MPYLGEIRMFGGTFAPVGWALCDGSLVSIADNDPLYTLIGTTYGGDGQETFGLPNLCGRVPVHQGRGPGIMATYVMGEQLGVEEVTLTTQQLPVHGHALMASTAGGSTPNPQGNVLASPPALTMYIRDTPSAPLPPQMVAPVGGSQPHENRMPYLAVTYIISLYGVYPSQT